MIHSLRVDPQTDVAIAIAIAVYHAFATVGLEGLKATSMFPSADKQTLEYKEAA